MRSKPLDADGTKPQPLTPEQYNAPGAYSFQPSGGLLPLVI
jgi:hypothetical protein